MDKCVDVDLTREVVARFLSSVQDMGLLFFHATRVERNGDCWLWRGSVDKEGYGFYVVLGRQLRPYRTFYEWATGGPFPLRLVPDHTCKTPQCVNPKHIEAVTIRVNTLRGNAPSALKVIRLCEHK